MLSSDLKLLKMSKPVVWVRYTGKDFDVGNAVKISEDSDKIVVLLARSKVEGDNGSVLLFGDYVVGERCAAVCTVDTAFKVEDFEVSISESLHLLNVSVLMNMNMKNSTLC